MCSKVTFLFGNSLIYFSSYLTVHPHHYLFQKLRMTSFNQVESAGGENTQPLLAHTNRWKNYQGAIRHSKQQLRIGNQRLSIFDYLPIR